MPQRTAYYDGCPTSHALDLIGDRWALLVVRELLLGAKRFTDLRRGLPRISRNVLSQRLDDLEAAGVLRRRVLPPPSSSAVYELTERGLGLELVLNAIGRWGARSPTLPEGDTVGVDTFVLGLRGMFNSPAAKGARARYEVVIDRETFEFDIRDGTLVVRRGGAGPVDAVIRVDPSAMAAASRGTRALATAFVAPDDGEPDRREQFAALFHRPDFGR